MQCNTEYPTPLRDANLRAMSTIKKKFNVSVGYSDHTQGIEAALAATALGANIIEKHITLNKNLTGPDHKASVTGKELKRMVKKFLIVFQRSLILGVSWKKQQNIRVKRSL